MCQGAFLKVYICLDLNLHLKSYFFQNEHIIVEKYQASMFPVGTVILEISINYYHLSYFLYHSLLSSDLC